jgi:hypothetical protein
MLRLSVFTGNFEARTLPPFIFFKGYAWDDKGLIEHETTHVRQFYKSPLNSIRYNFNKDIRYAMELEAYAVQLIADGISVSTASNFIYKDYNLEVPYKIIVKDLNAEVKRLKEEK